MIVVFTAPESQAIRVHYDGAGKDLVYELGAVLARVAVEVSTAEAAQGRSVTALDFVSHVIVDALQRLPSMEASKGAHIVS